MSPILITKCKTKIFTSILMVLFGLGLIGFGAWMINSEGSWWWLIAVAFGVFCVYHWVRILINGSMTLVLYVEQNQLYITYEHTKKIMSRLEEIKSFDYYTKVLNLDQIQRFWRYVVRTNGAVTSDVLYIKYNDKDQDLADLEYYGAKLEEEDLNKIVHFLLHYNPYIQLGKS